MTIRRHPLPPHVAAALDERHCDAPPPEAGRRYNPPHPIYGIVFLFLVAMALLLGASRGDGPGPLSRFGCAYAALLVCLCGAVHFLEGVEPSHLPAKLGLRRPPLAWISLGAAASLGAGFAVATGHLGTSGLHASQGASHPFSAAALVAMLGLAALWQEGFCRGYCFAGLMRRHGFVLAATSAGVISVAFTLFLAPMAFAHGSLATSLLELLLSVAQAQLFWSSQNLWPCLLVRVSVLLALFCGAYWPMGAAAAVLWIAAVCVARRASIGTAWRAGRR